MGVGWGGWRKGVGQKLQSGTKEECVSKKGCLEFKLLVKLELAVMWVEFHEKNIIIQTSFNQHTRALQNKYIFNTINKHLLCPISQWKDTCSWGRLNSWGFVLGLAQWENSTYWIANLLPVEISDQAKKIIIRYLMVLISSWYLRNLYSYTFH